MLHLYRPRLKCINLPIISHLYCIRSVFIRPYRLFPISASLGLSVTLLVIYTIELLNRIKKEKHHINFIFIDLFSNIKKTCKTRLIKSVQLQNLEPTRLHLSVGVRLCNSGKFVISIIQISHKK